MRARRWRHCWWRSVPAISPDLRGRRGRATIARLRPRRISTRFALAGPTATGTPLSRARYWASTIWWPDATRLDDDRRRCRPHPRAPGADPRRADREVPLRLRRHGGNCTRNAFDLDDALRPGRRARSRTSCPVDGYAPGMLHDRLSGPRPAGRARPRRVGHFLALRGTTPRNLGAQTVYFWPLEEGALDDAERPYRIPAALQWACGPDSRHRADGRLIEAPAGRGSAVLSDRAADRYCRNDTLGFDRIEWQDAGNLGRAGRLVFHPRRRGHLRQRRLCPVHGPRLSLEADCGQLWRPPSRSRGARQAGASPSPTTSRSPAGSRASAPS